VRPVTALPKNTGQLMHILARVMDTAKVAVKVLREATATTLAVARVLGKGLGSPTSGSADGSDTQPASPADSDSALADLQSSQEILLILEAEAPTQWGESVRVVGDHHRLGRWVPARSMLLEAAEYPLWTGRLRVAPGIRVEYKYLRQNPDGTFTWETLAQNRVLTASTSDREVRSHDRVSWAG
jgi:hypothetical protein